MEFVFRMCSDVRNKVRLKINYLSKLLLYFLTDAKVCDGSHCDHISCQMIIAIHFQMSIDSRGETYLERVVQP